MAKESEAISLIAGIVGVLAIEGYVSLRVLGRGTISSLVLQALIVALFSALLVYWSKRLGLEQVMPRISVIAVIVLLALGVCLMPIYLPVTAFQNSESAFDVFQAMRLFSHAFFKAAASCLITIGYFLVNGKSRVGPSHSG